MSERYNVLITMTERNDQNTLTIGEVAEMHRVSRRTVERWISHGDLPAQKLPGGLVRISREAAEALLAPVQALEPS